MISLRVKQILQTKPEEQEIEVKGWVRTKRESKAFSFIEVNDGSCLSNLQVVVDSTVEGYEDFISRLSTGASLKLIGTLKASPGQGQNVEVHALKVEVYGEADPETYPLQKKRHSLEFLREIAHLRPRTNVLGAVTRVRSALSFAIHKFFNDKGFLYIHTPIITSSDCEGAGEMFQVTTLPIGELKAGEVDYSKDFFGKKTALTVSGQLQAEIYACSLGNVYTFGPTFRAEHSNTSRHLAEFWMVEPEMAFCDLSGDMDVAEEFLKYIFTYILENCQEDMDLFDKWVEKGVIEKLQNVVKHEFARITYTEAIDHLIKAKTDFEFPVKWGIDLQSEHEKYITEQVFKKPVIVTDYPKDIKAFYMKMNDDGKTVRAMDILVPRLGEIIGGSERENDYNKLMTRINSMNLVPEDYWWYMDLRRYGTVPHAGFGLGFERALQFITGMQNIRDVIPFPRAWGSVTF